jgi:hypothetical protein
MSSVCKRDFLYKSPFINYRFASAINREHSNLIEEIL